LQYKLCSAKAIKIECINRIDLKLNRSWKSKTDGLFKCRSWQIRLKNNISNPLMWLTNGPLNLVKYILSEEESR
jgi:hypothetical protein